MKFSTTELSQFKATQSAHMMDECIIMVYSASYDAYGNAVDAYADSSPVACGLGAVGGSPASSEALGSTDVPISTHALRLPSDAVVSSLDRVRVTKRFGVTENSPRVYEIIGPVQNGPSGIVAKLRKVTE